MELIDKKCFKSSHAYAYNVLDKGTTAAMRRRKTEGSHRDSQLPRKKGNWVFIQMGSGKKQLKIIAATSMTIFSLLTCFMGAYAWFNSASQQSSDADGFTIYADSSLDILSAYAIRYDGVAGAKATNLLGSNVPAIAMSEYDYIFLDRNVNTPVFFRFEIAGFDTSKDLKITIPCEGSFHPEGSNQIIDNKLSNVVCAKFLTGLKSGSGTVKDDKDVTTAAGAKASYDGMIAYANEKNQDKTPKIPGNPYVTNVSTSTKVSSLQLTLNHSVVFDPSMLMDHTIDGNTVKKAVIFLELDYYVEGSVNLIKSYIDSYGSTTYSLNFEADITSMTLCNE